MTAKRTVRKALGNIRTGLCCQAVIILLNIFSVVFKVREHEKWQIAGACQFNQISKEWILNKLLSLTVLSVLTVLFIACGPINQENMAVDENNKNVDAKEKTVAEKPESKPSPSRMASTDNSAPAAAVKSRDASLKELVAGAAAALKSNGQKTTLAMINDPKGIYANGSYFVYVIHIKRNGKVIASGDKSLLNKNIYTKDSDKRTFIKSIIELAKSNPSGFLNYKWNNKPRSCYFEKISHLIVVGSN